LREPLTFRRRSAHFREKKRSPSGEDLLTFGRRKRRFREQRKLLADSIQIDKYVLIRQHEAFVVVAELERCG